MQRTERMTALIQSCAKWREPFKKELGPESCPLCVLYNRANMREDYCLGCPVFEDKERIWCMDTPFRLYMQSVVDQRPNDRLRLKEYQYLRGLWKKEKAKCQTSN